MYVALDDRRIPGWDRVDRLAGALLKLEGPCVINTHAG